MRCQRQYLQVALAELAVVVTALALLPLHALGLDLDDSDTFSVRRTWTVDDLGIDIAEGLFFSLDGNTLFVASGPADLLGSALYSLEVIRAPVTGEITALGDPEFIFSADPAIQDGGLTAGWAFGPGGTLFYPYGYGMRLGQRPSGIDGTEETFRLSRTGLSQPAAAGVAFSPHITDPNTQFGMMQLSDWTLFEHRVWNVPLVPSGDGYFEPRTAQVLAEFPGVRGWDGTSPSVAGDIAYIPSGRYQGDLLVADWNGGEINILSIDKETGWPVDRLTSVPTLGTFDPELVRFARVDKPWSAGNAPWGFEFDPLTNDLFISMSSVNGGPPTNSIIQVGGFPPPDEVRAGTLLRPGDADQDSDFDQIDVVQVLVGAKYLTGQAATWGEGDWDGAPGGSQGNPPVGDGMFNQLDIVAAQQAGIYLSGPYAAVGAGGQADDGQTSIVYNPGSGEVAVDAPAGTELTSINIDSAAGIFTGDAAQRLGGSFDNDADGNIFKATFGGSFGSVSFGNVAQARMTKEFVLGDLSVVGSLAGGGDLGSVDLIYVPEPTSSLLLAMALAIGLTSIRRAKH